MHTLIKWGVRAYVAAKLVKIAMGAKDRSPGENLKALLNTANTYKGAMISMSNFVGASIDPARQVERDRARESVPIVHSVASALIGAAGDQVQRVDEWTFGTDEGGNLIATHDNGTVGVLVRADQSDTSSKK